MNFTVKELPDSRYEAVSILQRFAGQQAAADVPMFTDLHRDTAETAKDLGLSSREETELFAAMRTVYDEVLMDAAQDEPWLGFYFSSLSADGMSLGKLVYYMRYAFPDDHQLTETIRQTIAEGIREEGSEPLSGQEATIRAILDSELDAGPKVRLLDFYLEPLAHLARCDAMIEAYAARFRQRQALLLPLYTRFAEELRHDTDACLLTLKLDIDNFAVQPTIYNYDGISLHTLPARDGAGAPFVSYGILVDFISRRAKDEARGGDKLLRALKALDDKTRLRILTALREGPMYGHELAKLTGLSAATISHHISELFSKDLILLEKQGTSARYSLRGETIEWVIGELRRLV